MPDNMESRPVFKESVDIRHPNSKSMTVTEDLHGNLLIFVRLTKAGHFARAKAFYNESLEHHKDRFPIIAEYADMLIDQGAFGDAEVYLGSVLYEQSGSSTAIVGEEREVLKLINALARIHTKFDGQAAADIARNHLSKDAISTLLDRPTFCMLQCTVYAVRIMDILTEHASGAGPFETAPHFTYNEMVTFINWLFDSGRPWEATNLLEIYLRRGNLHLLEELGTWLKITDTMQSQKDTMSRLAGLTCLGHYCVGHMAPAWRDFLSHSDPPTALVSAPPSANRALMKLHSILPTNTYVVDTDSSQTALLQNLPMIDIGPGFEIASSRAFKTLQMVKWDEVLFNATFVSTRKEQLPDYSSIYESTLFQDMNNHIVEHADYRLQSEACWRNSLVATSEGELSVVQSLHAFWTASRDSFTCWRLLYALQRDVDRLSSADSALKQLQRELEIFAGIAPDWVLRNRSTTQPTVNQGPSYHLLEMIDVEARRNHVLPEGTSRIHRVVGRRLQDIRSYRAPLHDRTRDISLKTVPSKIAHVVSHGPHTERKSANFLFGKDDQSHNTYSETRDNVKRVLLLGHTGSGKSSFINALTGSQLLTSDGLKPCTAKIAVVRSFLDDIAADIDVIDTPGSGDPKLTEWEILQQIQDFLGLEYNSGRRLHCVVYLIDLTTLRLDDTHDLWLQVLEGLVGHAATPNVQFVFTHGMPESEASLNAFIKDRYDEQQRRFNEYRTTRLRGALHAGANTWECHLFGKPHSESEKLMVRNKMCQILGNFQEVELRCQKEIVIDRKGSSNTTAAGAMWANFDVRDYRVSEQQTLLMKQQEELQAKEQAIIAADRKAQQEYQASKQRAQEESTAAEEREKKLKAERAMLEARKKEEQRNAAMQRRKLEEKQAELEAERKAAENEEELRRLRTEAEREKLKELQRQAQKDRLAAEEERKEQEAKARSISEAEEKLKADKEEFEALRKAREEREATAATAAEEERLALQRQSEHAKRLKELEKIKAEQARNDERLQELQKERQEYARQKNAIEAEGSWLPRIIIYNESQVNIHLRLFTDIGHLVWDYMNDVLPNTFAQLVCPAPGFYNIDICLATGTGSTFSKREQIAGTVGKIVAGVTMIALPGAGLYGAAVLESAFLADAATGVMVAGVFGRGLLASLGREFSNTEALIDIEAETGLSNAASDLLIGMQKACSGKRELSLVDQWPFGVGKLRRITLSGGPSASFAEEEGRTKIIYKFTKSTQALQLMPVEGFRDEQPADTGVQ